MQYDTISEVYDRFNDGFDYEKYLNTVFRRFHPRETGLVIDCGCGTGVLMEIPVSYTHLTLPTITRV